MADAITAQGAVDRVAQTSDEKRKALDAAVAEVTTCQAALEQALAGADSEHV
jgi:hypothetical protein